MIYGYIRVSTEKQTLINQKLEIRRYCSARRMYGITWIQETVSGAKSPEKRQLGRLLSMAKQGDVIVCTELSRLGRSLVMIFDVLEILLNKKVKVITIKDGFELGDDVQSKVLAFAFGLSAEIERKLISERTKIGLARARKQGKQIGRLPGQKPNKYKLTGYERYIRKRRREGCSKNALAKELSVTWITLNTFMKKNKLR